MRGALLGSKTPGSRGVGYTSIPGHVCQCQKPGAVQWPMQCLSQCIFEIFKDLEMGNISRMNIFGSSLFHCLGFTTSN